MFISTYLTGCGAQLLLLKRDRLLIVAILIHFHRVQDHLLTPLQATDPGGTITMVTGSGRSFNQQIKTEDTAVQETNPATLGQLVFETLTKY